MNKNQIIYLCSKYTGREAECLAENMDWKWRLEEKGYLTVFSPVINSAFEDWCKDPTFRKLLNIELNMQGGIESAEMQAIHDFASKLQYISNPSKIDYVQYDLRLLQKWLNNDSKHQCFNYQNKGSCPCEFFNHDATDKEFCQREFDSGVVLAFLPSCFNHNETDDREQWDWQSKGAKIEYDFAKKHHIECVLAESLLTDNVERIKGCPP